MSGDKQHSRVTPQGRAMGQSAARLADLGRQRLQSLGQDAGIVAALTTLRANLKTPNADLSGRTRSA